MAPKKDAAPAEEEPAAGVDLGECRYQARLALLAQRWTDVLEALRPAAEKTAEDCWLRYCAWRRWLEGELPRLEKLRKMEAAAGVSKERVWATQRRHRVETELLDLCAAARADFDGVPPVTNPGEDGEEGDRELSAVCALALLDLACLAAKFQSLEPYRTELAGACDPAAQAAFEAASLLPPQHAVRLQAVLLWSTIGSAEGKHAPAAELLLEAQAQEKRLRAKTEVQAIRRGQNDGVSALAEVAAFPPGLAATSAHLEELRPRVEELALLEAEAALLRESQAAEVPEPPPAEEGEAEE